MKDPEDQKHTLIRDPVSHLPSVTQACDKPFDPQPGKLARDIGLAGTQCLFKLTNRSFSWQERTEQAQSCGIGQHLQEFSRLCCCPIKSVGIGRGQ